MTDISAAMMPDVLLVVRGGQVVGELERLRTGLLRFRYLDGAAALGPLSVAMPLDRRRHADGVVRPWIEGLFPDRPALLRNWRRQFAINEDHPFDLLAMVGEDVAGAAQFVRPDRLDVVLSSPGTLTPLTDSQLQDLVTAALADEPIVDDAAQTGRFSLAGAQSKLALQRLNDGWALPTGAVPSSHILKPAIPGLPDQDLVEALTMQTARALGLSVAAVDLITVGSTRVLIAERFDRLFTDVGWIRIHQEDLCQALAVNPARKYEAEGGPTAGAVSRLIRHVSSRPVVDVERFAKAVIFNALVGGTDAHARNYALLHHGGSTRLAPLYDLNTWAPYGDLRTARMSMSVGGEFRLTHLTTDSWRWFAATVELPEEFVLDEVARQREELPRALAQVRKQLTAADRSEPIDRLIRQLTP